MKMKHRLVWAAAACGLLATGCVAKLETDIRMFDPSCLDEGDVLAPRVAQVEQLFTDEAFRELEKEIKGKAARAWAKNGLPDSERGPYDEKVTELIAQVEHAAALNRQALSDYENGEFESAKQNFAAANASLSSMLELYNGTIRMMFDAGKVEGVDALRDTIKRGGVRLAGNDLYTDPYLSLVLYARPNPESKSDDEADRPKTPKTARQHAKATEACWVARADHTMSRGWSGNTDIAVNMRDDGTFTVKGLRLDASKITQSIFKMSTQAVCLVASIYGVGGCSTTQGVTEMFDPETEELAIAERKRIALQILEDIVANEANAQGALEAGLPALTSTLPCGAECSTGDKP